MSSLPSSRSPPTAALRTPLSACPTCGARLAAWRGEDEGLLTCADCGDEVELATGATGLPRPVAVHAYPGKYLG